MNQMRLWGTVLPNVTIKRTRPKIAVLGCGPAGLLAAHAVAINGGEPVVYSIKQKSEIPGSVMLHAAIPGLTGTYPDNVVSWVRMGTSEGYARKVYGDPKRFTGWDHYSQSYPSWNAIKAYNKLWDLYQECVIDMHLDTRAINTIQDRHDIVISTVPQQAICNLGHRFDGVPYWIKPLPLPEGEAGREIVIVNGRPEDTWYRYSILGDKCSIESTYGFDGEGIIEGIKVVSTDCDCWPGLVKAGRWAEWRHGVLLNHAFEKVYNLVREGVSV